MRSDPNSFSYSSSSVMSYSNDGSGQPAYYHATSSERKGPGGVCSLEKFLLLGSCLIGCFAMSCLSMVSHFSRNGRYISLQSYPEYCGRNSSKFEGHLDTQS